MIPKIDQAEPLNLLYDLILQEDISQEERDLLVEAKNMIEAGDNALPVFNLLLGQLRSLAIGRCLSKPVSDFYLKAMTRPANDQKFWGLIHAARSLTSK